MKKIVILLVISLLNPLQASDHDVSLPYLAQHELVSSTIKKLKQTSHMRNVQDLNAIIHKNALLGSLEAIRYIIDVDIYTLPAFQSPFLVLEGAYKGSQVSQAIALINVKNLFDLDTIDKMQANFSFINKFIEQQNNLHQENETNASSSSSSSSSSFYQTNNQLPETYIKQWLCYNPSIQKGNKRTHATSKKQHKYSFSAQIRRL